MALPEEVVVHIADEGLQHELHDDGHTDRAAPKEKGEDSLPQRLAWSDGRAEGRTRPRIVREADILNGLEPSRP